MAAAATASLPSPPLFARRAVLVAAVLAMVGAVLFGLKGVVVKCAYQVGGEATVLLTWRLLLSVPAFAVVLWLARRKAATPLTRRDLMAAAAWGIVGFHMASWVNFIGLERIGAGLERMVLFIYPVLVVAFTHVRDRRPPALGLVGAALLTWIGIIVAWWHHALAGAADPIGIALVAASAVIFALFMTGSERLCRRVGTQGALAMGMIGACAGMLLQTVITRPLHALAISPPVFMWALLLAGMCTVAPVVLQAAALPVLGVARLAVVSTVGPVGTLIFAWIMLGEQPGWLGGVGALVTIAGGAWCALAKSPPSAVKEPRIKVNAVADGTT